MLLFMDYKHNFPNDEDIDHIVSGKIPDKSGEPRLYEVVKKTRLCEFVKDMMIHWPCCVVNKNSPCMDVGRCTNFFLDNTLRKLL